MTGAAKRQCMVERMRVLATVILTRRDDLELVETKKDTGIDFHVRVQREEKSMRLTFGLFLRGVLSEATAKNANKILVPTLAQFRGMRHFTYPVCLFFFTMHDDQAYFTWLAEPVVAEGAPKLTHHEKAHCVPLTNELLDQAIEQIVSWYDAVETVLIA